MAKVTKSALTGTSNGELPCHENGHDTHVGLAHLGSLRGRATYPLTKKRKRLFLDALANGVSTRKAAEVAQASLTSLHRARHEEPAFAAAWLDSYDMSIESAELRLEAIVFDDGATDRDVIRAAEVLLRGRSARYR